MLRRLLAVIAGRQGVCSYDELARELGVSRLLVEQLVYILDANINDDGPDALEGGRSIWFPE